jgi:hypothetical protein
MHLGEYFYKEFDAKGSYEYLSRWAAEIDQMYEEDWSVVGSVPKATKRGLWMTCLWRDPDHAKLRPKEYCWPENM